MAKVTVDVKNKVGVEGDEGKDYVVEILNSGEDGTRATSREFVYGLAYTLAYLTRNVSDVCDYADEDYLSFSLEVARNFLADYTHNIEHLRKREEPAWT